MIAWKILVALWKWLLGAVMCFMLPTAVLAIGWTYRAMQRQSVKVWGRQRRGKPAEEPKKPTIVAPPVDDFAEVRRYAEIMQGGGLKRENVIDEPREAEPAKPGATDVDAWPNWLLSNRSHPAGGAGCRSLADNFRFGVQGIFNTWVVTLPACVLWQFAWRFGWDNSFHKLYEQAAIGPMTGFAGIMVFIAVMFYVPMAQARQAATGDWRSFYHYRFVREIVKEKWASCVVLAGLYSLLALPIIILQALPLFEYSDPKYAELSDREFLYDLMGYYGLAALYVFPAYVLAHAVAARVYARGVLKLIAKDSPQLSRLGSFERQKLDELNLLNPPPRNTPPVLVQAVHRTFLRMVRFATGFAAGLLWFTFVAQIFVREFFFYHPVIGWLNQALVQLPTITYIPLDLMGNAF